MKSFRLNRTDLYRLREVIPSSPYPADPHSGRQPSYSGDDLEMVETVCSQIDTTLGEYRTERRNNSLRIERELRQARQIKDHADREIAAAVAYDRSAEAIEVLDARLGSDLVVVSLEDSEAEWLSDNWSKRTDWNGADAVRSSILAIRRALKKDAMIEWRAKERNEPTVDDFDKKDDKVVTLKPKADSGATETQSAEAVG